MQTKTLYCIFLSLVVANNSSSSKNNATLLLFQPFDRNYVWYDKSYEARLTFLNSGQVEIRFIGLPDEGEYFCIPKSYHADPKSTRSTVVTVFGTKNFFNYFGHLVCQTVCYVTILQCRYSSII